nr:cupin domain-containing protein [Gordonia desulfuricans]
MGHLREDDAVRTGFWIVRPDETPGPVTLTLPFDRTIYVVEGAVEYAVTDGPTYRIAAGDAASFVKGSEVTFTVLEDLRQFYVDSL